MKLSMLALGAALSLSVNATHAQAQNSHDSKNDQKAAAPEAGDMMAMFVEMSRPGAEHKLLEPFIGEWTVKSSFWMDATQAEPEVSTATSKTEWIMDGRYQRQTYTGDFMGMPFKGEGLLGFNKVTGEYFSTWIDSMSTGLGTSQGKVDPTGKIFSFTGSYDDPMSGGKSVTREIITIKNPNEYTVTSYGVMPDGSEFKQMMLEFKRAK
jgi:hypothetical protein